MKEKHKLYHSTWTPYLRDVTSSMKQVIFVCNNCAVISFYDSKFCPTCGCFMENSGNVKFKEEVKNEC